MKIRHIVPRIFSGVDVCDVQKHLVLFAKMPIKAVDRG